MWATIHLCTSGLRTVPVAELAGPVARSNAEEPVDDDLTPESFEDEQPLKVTPFTFEGAEYLINKASGDLYCTHTHELLGVFHEVNGDVAAHVEFLEEDSDEEE